MKSIEILTPQNIVIEHELAGVALRGLAFLLDQIVIILFLLLSYMMIVALDWDGMIGDLFFFVVVIPVYFLYSLLFESYYYGQTPGKKIVGIKVRRLDGHEVTFTEALTRWITRIPDIFISAGALATILIHSTERQQRLGDILAGTIVIRQSPAHYLTINNLLQISTTKDYQPLYPQVVRLSEEDVVLIKQTLNRYKKYKNKAHGDAVDLLAQKLAILLEIKEIPEANQEFLRRLLKDFIVLTR